MSEGCGDFVIVLKTFVYDCAIDFVGCITCSQENHHDLLRDNLTSLCRMVDDINIKVQMGRDKGEGVSTEAKDWLQLVRKLSVDEHLKELMYMDIETARLVMKLITKKDLKRCLSEEREMQKVVVELIKKLQEEMEHYSHEDDTEVVEEKVVEVLVELIKDTIEKFKKLIKEDMKMAIIAINTLNDRDLDILMKRDKELEEIVAEAMSVSDEELWLESEDEESSTSRAGVESNRLKEAARKLLSPLENLLTPFVKLMDDPYFKNVVPIAEELKLELGVIAGLWVSSLRPKKEMDYHTRCCQHLGHNKRRKVAEKMADLIKNDILNEFPKGQVTGPYHGLKSRSELVDKILEKLEDDQVGIVGLFGMGGTGKTRLAKEVSKKARDIFRMIVIVETKELSHIMDIQKAIADSIGLPVNDTDSIDVRAVKIYNRISCEAENQVLIIFDNVYKKLDFDKIGIPRTCKFLLTTRNREVCRVMSVRDVDILEVGLIDPSEAKDLFMSQVKYPGEVDFEEYEKVVERLLGNCGGLPLLIIAMADLLKGKDFHSWENIANQADRNHEFNHETIYSMLDFSYKHIEVGEKRIFFLLACLSPPGSSISIETLSRYGIGLNLFQRVEKLCEAMELANDWTNELISSTMLLEGDAKGDFKIHGIVRTFAISIAAKAEAHKFVVEDIPCVLDGNTSNEYTAMSLMYTNDYSRRSGVVADKLQILKLRGDQSTRFADSFFEGMGNLKVLDLSNIIFESRLPDSICKLEKLRTLCMEGCKLGDIKQIGELVNLLVLSLRDSFVETLPSEIGKLCKLRLLDLTECRSNGEALIPSGFLDKLSRLEGLYLLNATKSSAEGTSATEYFRLPRLNALEIEVTHVKELLSDGQSAQHLDRFKVFVGDSKCTWRTAETLIQFSRVVGLNDIDDLSGILARDKYLTLNTLVKKADWLWINSCTKFEHLVPQLNQEGFRDLTSLGVSHCDNVECIVKGRGMNNDLIAFPCLRVLDLRHLWSLKMVCDGEVPPGTFANLQTLRLAGLEKLEYALPLALLLHNLTLVHVSHCRSLNSIFIQNEETHVVKLPFLKSLKLFKLPNLINLVSPEDIYNISHALFDGKIVYPSLKLLKLEGCDNVVTVWSKRVCTSGFQNLKHIKINGCGQLLSVGPPSVFSELVRLETLSISFCHMLEVVTPEVSIKWESCEQSIIFPQLKFLELNRLMNLESFYVGKSRLLFPRLQKLILDKVESMKKFAKLDNSPALFHKSVELPNLEELYVKRVNDEVLELWESQEYNTDGVDIILNPVPMLQRLTLSNEGVLRQIPGDIFQNLHSLEFTEMADKEFMFSSSDLSAEKGLLWTYSEHLKLEELKVKECSFLKEWFEKEEDSNELSLLCGQLKTLELEMLPNLNLIPLHLFKGLASLTLSGLKWKYLISGRALVDSLKQLEFLEIEDCEEMETLFTTDDLVIELPRLKKLEFTSLDSFRSFSSTPTREATLRLPLLESLTIKYCEKLELFWFGSVFAPKLQDLDLFVCQNMRHVFKGNTKHSVELPSLQRVCIYGCYAIKSFSTVSLTAPTLRDIRLAGCHGMHCFLWANPDHNGDPHLPSLEVVNIEDSPNLHSFFQKSLPTPKLTQIEYDHQTYSMLPFNDLNHFLLTVTSADYGAELNTMFGEGDWPFN